MMSIFVHTDCCDYVVLDFRQQLKTSLKGVEMSGGSKWERGGVGDIIGSFKKDIIIPLSLSAPFVGSVLTCGSLPW